MVRLNVIAGFLGSGKTSAVKWILQERSSTEKIALLVNEFGTLDIDGETLQTGDAVKQINLPSGCICCELKGPLQDAVKEICEVDKPDRLIIEPTGIAVPRDIVKTVQAEELKGRIQVSALIAVADPRMVITMAEKRVPFFWEQLHQSSKIFLNKCDLASQEEIDRAKKLFADELLAYDLQEGEFGKIPLQWLDLPMDSISSQGNTQKSAAHASGTGFSVTVPHGELSEKRIKKLFKLLSKGLYGFSPWRAKALLLLESGPNLVNLSMTGEIDVAPANSVFAEPSEFMNRFVVIAGQIPDESRVALETDLQRAALKAVENI